MLIIGITIFVLALFLLAIKRYFKFPDIDDIRDLLTKSNINSLYVSSKLFGITELSFSKNLVLEPSDQVEPSIEPEETIKKIVKIKSEMVGYFHWLKTKEEHLIDPVGKIVKKGEIIAHITTFKIPVDLESSVDGKILMVLFEDDSPVEYGQALFLVEES